jgi:mono/diheme cytochrome c family protein
MLSRVHTGRMSFLAAAIVVAAAACGSSGGGSTATSTGQEARGKTIFVETGCGACHALKAAGTHGLVGGPLDGAKLAAADVADRVRNGGGGMPAFAKRLTSKQIAAVAAFVADASR